MLYLKELKIVFKENIMLGLVFLTSMFVLIAIAHSQREIQHFSSLLNKQSNAPYFNALVSSGVNIENLQRKVYKLPGVLKIDRTKDPTISKELDNLEKTFGSNILSQIKADQYTRLKIVIEKSLKASSQKLIREYLTRLVGEESITIGSIRTPRQVELKKNDPLFVLLNWSSEYLALIFWAINLFCAYLLMRSINAQAFIIQKFQRKKFVREKIVLTAFILFAALFSLVIVSMQGQFSINKLTLITYGAILMTPFIALINKRKIKI